jgi:hypothetical protein
MPRVTTLAVVALGIVALSLGLAACTAGDGVSDATWRLAPPVELDSETTTFEILVSRVECNSGVTGTVKEPSVEFGDEDVVITVRVSPGSPQAATCQGNNEVPYTLRLDQPIGDRVLIDGGCRGGEAAATVFCDSAVRGRP